jgi:hypothetical protein
MHNKSVAVFSNNFSDMAEDIGRIKLFFQQQSFDDFVIFSDELLDNLSDHSVLTTFYLIAYRGILIFTDINDYLQYKDSILCDPVLYIPKYDYSISAETIKYCDILTYDENTANLKWIKKHELQRSI